MHFDKQSWRDRNRNWILRSPVTNRKKIRCSIVEMAGAHPCTFETFRPYLRDPKQFLAVNNVFEDYVSYARETEKRYLFQKDRPTEVFHNMYNVSRDAIKAKPAAAVFLFDTQHTTHRFHEHREDYQDIVRLSLDASGVCVLVLNYVLDRPMVPTTADSLIEHTTSVCEAFKAYGARPSRFLGYAMRLAQQLTPSRAAEDDQIGAYHIYRCANRNLRMATLRLTFTPQTLAIENEARRN